MKHIKLYDNFNADSNMSILMDDFSFTKMSVKNNPHLHYYGVGTFDEPVTFTEEILNELVRLNKKVKAEGHRVFFKIEDDCNGLVFFNADTLLDCVTDDNMNGVDLSNLPASQLEEFYDLDGILPDVLIDYVEGELMCNIRLLIC